MMDLQRQLCERFSDLRDSRRGSVFFVEHGLSAAELDDLRADVRASLRVKPLESGWWDQRDLPLLVAATEVGYRYQGAGTDFWPRLEEELGSGLPAESRQRVKDFFIRAAERFRGARPANTAWAHAFHLIAWPITHALLPVEFHRPLALTLANLRASGARADDDALYRAIRDAAPFPTARFATLLEDVGVVVALARCLLGQRIEDLSAEIVRRLSCDLESDALARRGVAVARSIQRASASLGGKVHAPSASETRGSLQLRRVNGGVALEAHFPPLEPDTANRLRGALRRRRFSPRLWGLTARVPSDQLLSGLPFVLKLTEVPPPDTHVFLDPDLEGLDPQDLAVLRRFDLRLELPLLFAVGTEGEVARQVRGNEVSGHRVYWLLERKDVERRGVKIVGEIGTLRCLELDPKSDGGARALAGLGYRVRYGVSVRFAGHPPISRDDAIPAFVAGEHRVLVPQRLTNGTSLSLSRDGQAAVVSASEVARVVVGEGDQRLQAFNDTDRREYTFRGVKSAQPPARAVQVALRSEERTLQALLAGRLSFVVDAFAPVSGLQLTVDLEAAGRRFSATGPLDPLPQAISSEHPVLRRLLADDVRGLASDAASVTLRAQVGHLASASWQLERTVRPCWWDVRAAPVLLSEAGPLGFGVICADEPTSGPTARSCGDDAYLLAPTGLDPIEFGAAAPFAALCLAPARAQLELPSVCKPRLTRRRRGVGSSVGLDDLMEAYLRWSLAETRSVIGDLRRGQVSALLDAWVAEVCCGAEWAQAEAALPHERSWVLLEQACRDLRLGRDSYLELTPAREAEVRRLAIAEIRRSMPGLWTRVGPPSDLGPEDYESLDRAFASAYGLLATRCRARGEENLADELDEADPGDDPELWDQALGQALQSIEMRSLAAMLLPSDSALRLMRLDVGGLSVDEIADEMLAWSKASRRAFVGPPPSRDTLKAIYALWVEPEVALSADWRGALDTLLTERPIARAARYLAIKARDARRGAV